MRDYIIEIQFWRINCIYFLLHINVEEIIQLWILKFEIWIMMLLNFWVGHSLYSILNESQESSKILQDY